MPKKDTWRTIKEKGAEVVDSMKENPTVKDMSTAARKNPKEAILAILMVLGLVFSFYWLGSLVVGLAASLYAPWTIKDVYERALRFYDREGKFPSIMLGLALLFLLIHTFWFVIGGLIGLTVKLFFKKVPPSAGQR